MHLHHAVRSARVELKLSQKKLAEKAGIQRRQLATLENGGNVTLATVRKVLAQLPNLESFTLDTVNVNVNSDPQPFDADKFSEILELMTQALETMAKRLRQGQLPNQDDAAALHEVKARFLAGMTPADRAVVLNGRPDTFTVEGALEAADAEEDEGS